MLTDGRTNRASTVPTAFNSPAWERGARDTTATPKQGPSDPNGPQPQGEAELPQASSVHLPRQRKVRGQDRRVRRGEGGGRTVEATGTALFPEWRL